MATGYGRRIRRLQVDWANGKAPAAPAAWYVSLHTADPGDDGQTANEVTGTGYARKQLAGGAADWNASSTPALGSPSIATNAVAILFAAAGGSWAGGANVTHFGLWDSLAGTGEANFIGRGTVTPAQAFTTGNTPNFAIGQLAMQNDDT